MKRTSLALLLLLSVAGLAAQTSERVDTAAIEKIREQGLKQSKVMDHLFQICLLYTSDAADERSSVDLGGRRIIKKKKLVANDNTGSA